MIKQLVTAAVAAVTLAAASPSFAGGKSGKSHKKAPSCGYICKKIKKYKKSKKKMGKKPAPKAVPEIDAAGAAISLALLAGVVSIGRERRKSKLAK